MPITSETSSSRTEAAQLASHHERDLRARTLTTLLAALSAVTAVPADTTDDRSSIIRDDSGRDTRKSITFLKLLNYVAQVLVREHEIVAVLSKSSTRFDILIATDNTSSGNEADDWMAATDGYLITRNPRWSPEPLPQDIAARLRAISTQEDMLQYLHSYRHVPFSHHVQGIEILFNAIVDANNTYTTLRHNHQHVESAKDHLELRKELLILFVIFYSTGKMCRRFRSVLFAKFQMEMHNMLEEDVENISPSSPGICFTSSEIGFFKILLADKLIAAAGTYPRLSAAFSDPENEPRYCKQTAWEFHRLLLSVLDTARAAMETVHTTIQCKDTTSMEISAAMSDVRCWMARLYLMVHQCSATTTHMQALEPILSVGKLVPPTAVLDDDGGATDTTIEITLAYKESRVGEECLWLITRYQTALRCLTAPKTLPRQPVSFTLCDVSAADEGVTKTAMHNWKDVIMTLYPPRPDDTQPSDMNIYAEEAIDTLKEYSERTNTPAAKRLLRSPPYVFSGCWHAEAFLGTLRHLSQFPAPPTHLPIPRDIDLTRFRYTFCTIGVSKRCCPICTKLLSLLGSQHGRPGSPEPNYPTATHPMVLGCHQNFYPTALPPYLPHDIAVALLHWLESLVEPLVTKLVLKRRRLSKDSPRSIRSSDSKGDSPNEGDSPTEEDDNPVFMNEMQR